MQVAAVFACVRVVSSAFASLPLLAYRRDGDSRTRATDHYLYDLLKYRVNPFTTSYLWKQHLATSLMLHGNAYSQIIYNGRAQTTALYPLSPSRMTVTREVHGLRYEYQTDSGSIGLPSDTVLHVRGLSVDGFMGISPLEAARQAVGIALASEKHTARFFSQGMTVGTKIKIPAALDAAKAKEAKSAILGEHQSAINAHKPLFLFGGADAEHFTISHQDLQFLELRKFTVAEIARIFGVPLHMLGELDRATFSNIEQQSLEFMRDTLRPLVHNVEAELNTTLLSDYERQHVFCEFLLDDYVRSDIKSRYDALSVAVGKGMPWMTPNEARAKENLPAMEGGDKLYFPRQNTPDGQEEPTNAQA